MQFGVKQGVEPAWDADSSGSGGSYIKYFKEEQTTLRFLEEIPEWTSVWMHFNNTKNRDYPCTDDKPTCPGHNSDNEREAKAAKRYIVNALDVNTGYVDLWKIPYSIIDDLLRQADRFGTIMDRDYTVIKNKVGNKTDYSVDREEKSVMDLSEHRAQMKDHQEALENAFREVWGGLPDEEDYTGGDFGRAPITKSGYLTPVRDTKEDFPEHPPTEPAVQQDEDKRELTMDQLYAMDVNEIIDVYKTAEVPVPAFKDKDELVTKLVAALS